MSLRLLVSTPAWSLCQAVRFSLTQLIIGGKGYWLDLVPRLSHGYCQSNGSMMNKRGNHRGIVSAASTEVSKTFRVGSNPTTPAQLQHCKNLMLSWRNGIRARLRT